MNFDAAMVNYGLSIMPRKPNVSVYPLRRGRVLQYTWGYSESEDEYNARFRLALRAHSLVMQYLGQRDVPFRDEGYNYYDVLKLACKKYGVDYDKLFAEYERKIAEK